MSALQLGILILLPRKVSFFNQWCFLNYCDPICPIWHTQASINEAAAEVHIVLFFFPLI